MGVGGTINGYGALVLGDRVHVERDGEPVARRTVEGLGGFVRKARDLKLGWGRFPDGAEVLSLSDQDDGGFGYAVNPTSPACSEWGYAPFAA